MSTNLSTGGARGSAVAAAVSGGAATAACPAARERAPRPRGGWRWLRLGPLPLVALLLAVAFPGQALATKPRNYCMDPQEREFLHLINDYRASKGLHPLVALKTLGAAAEHHSRMSARHGESDHVMPDGTTITQNLSNHGYPTATTYRYENIYHGSWDHSEFARGAFDWWKSSPGHNAMMLKSNIKAMGVGRAKGGNTWYWTLLTGSSAKGARAGGC
jgi:uncharacterized protein YkwD